MSEKRRGDGQQKKEDTKNGRAEQAGYESTRLSNPEEQFHSSAPQRTKQDLHADLIPPFLIKPLLILAVIFGILAALAKIYQWLFG